MTETFIEVRRALLALADRCEIVALARRYRMLVTAIEQLTRAAGWRADNLRASIAKLLTEIAQIRRDGFYDNPLAQLRRDPQ